MKKSTLVILLIGCIVLVLIYFSYDPSQTAFFPKCPFFTVTGLKCPGCGSQRAFHQMIHLRFDEAFRYNAMLIILLPILVILLFSEVIRTKKPALYKKIQNRYTIYSALVLIVGWFILRNIFNW